MKRMHDGELDERFCMELARIFFPLCYRAAGRDVTYFISVEKGIEGTQHR